MFWEPGAENLHAGFRPGGEEVTSRPYRIQTHLFGRQIFEAARGHNAVIPELLLPTMTLQPASKLSDRHSNGPMLVKTVLSTLSRPLSALAPP